MESHRQEREGRRGAGREETSERGEEGPRTASSCTRHAAWIASQAALRSLRSALLSRPAALATPIFVPFTVHCALELRVVYSWPQELWPSTVSAVSRFSSLRVLRRRWRVRSKGVRTGLRPGGARLCAPWRQDVVAELPGVLHPEALLRHLVEVALGKIVRAQLEDEGVGVEGLGELGAEAAARGLDLRGRAAEEGGRVGG